MLTNLIVVLTLVYQIITLYTLKLHNVLWQLCLQKAGKK